MNPSKFSQLGPCKSLLDPFSLIILFMNIFPKKYAFYGQETGFLINLQTFLKFCRRGGRKSTFEIKKFNLMYNRTIVDRTNRGIISGKNASFSLRNNWKSWLAIIFLKIHKQGGVLISSGIGKRFEKLINVPPSPYIY